MQHSSRGPSAEAPCRDGAESSRGPVRPRAAAAREVAVSVDPQQAVDVLQQAALDGVQALGQEDLIPSEPTTIVLSKSGWVRAAKGHEIDPTSLASELGCPTEEIEAALLRLEKKIQTRGGEPLVEERLTLVGQTLSEMPQVGPHYGSVQAILLDSEARGIHTEELMVLWEKEIGILPGIKALTFAGMEAGRPVGGRYYHYRVMRQLDAEGIGARMLDAALSDVGEDDDVEWFGVALRSHPLHGAAQDAAAHGVRDDVELLDALGVEHGLQIGKDAHPCLNPV